jgi:cyclin C
LVRRSRFILNDTYRTDLSILYSPYIIALAALYLSFSLEDKSPRDPFRVRGQTVSSLDRTSLTINEISRGEDRSAMDRLIIRAKAAGYFADFAISIPTMLTIVQEIISLYPLWEELEGRNTFSVVKAAQNEGDHQEVSASVPPVKPADSLREIEIVPMIQKMQRARALDMSSSADAGVDAVQTASVNDAADIERSRTLDVASGKDGGVLAGAKRRHPD